jgi:DNA repair exonuclease SbcCD ATPase subunit
LNITYIANLYALRRWYKDVRAVFFNKHHLDELLLTGALNKITMAIDERINRLKEVVERLPESIAIHKKLHQPITERLLIFKRELHKNWKHIEETLTELLNYQGDQELMEGFLRSIEILSSSDYVSTIKSLGKDQKTKGTRWLYDIVREIEYKVYEFLPG